MPELPDITIYLEALQRRILEQPLERIRIASPFLVRMSAQSMPSFLPLSHIPPSEMGSSSAGNRVLYVLTETAPGGRLWIDND